MPETIGIFLHGQKGDIMSAMSVLKYKESLWGDAKIVWYADECNFDLFKYQDVELRIFPRGFGYPEMVQEENIKLISKGKKPAWEDWKPLVDKNNHLNLELKKNYPSLDDIDYGYFPAPHQMTPIQRHNIDYPSCSKKIFEVPFEREWHPCLSWSDEEREKANRFINKMDSGRKIMIETFAGSGQSQLDEEMIIQTMNMCNEHWGECNFIFASHKYLKKQESFPEGFFKMKNVYSCADFTVRQCALITNKSHLMISVSSGVTVASSAWGVFPLPILQYTGSWVCSTKSLANGPFELVTCDDKRTNEAKKQYYLKLLSLLSIYK